MQPCSRSDCDLLCQWKTNEQEAPELLKISPIHVPNQQIDFGIDQIGQLNFMGFEYKLKSLVIGNGGHFICYFIDNDEFFIYDDLSPQFQKINDFSFRPRSFKNGIIDFLLYQRLL